VFVKAGLARFRMVAFSVLAAFLGVAGCDDDPASPNAPPITFALVGSDTIGIQDPLRVELTGPFDAATVLNPENFIVINLCTGLRVTGALRLEGNVLSFSPSTALPFLTPLAVRIQNLLDTLGRPQLQPFTFDVITERPPVSDASWQLLNSPTNAFVTGVSFVDSTYGFISTQGGEIYRTENAGQTFAAIYKNLEFRSFRNVRALDRDTLYVVGAPSFGGTTFTTAALFRSVDAGQTFSIAFTANPANFLTLSLRRVGTNPPVLVMGGNQGALAAWRFDEANDSVHVFGPIGGQLGFGADLSNDASHAVVVGANTSQTAGVAYRSTNGGRTYVAITLPANTLALRGAGFLDNTSSLLLGDSSTVLRLNAATGTVTTLGAANGIPQTVRDQASGEVRTFTFTKAEFPPNSNGVGWIIGFERVTRPGLADITRGVLMISRDGGQNFVRQAVQGTPNNGLGFPVVNDIDALSNRFAAASGANGFLAARIGDIQTTAVACSFEAP
jgi:photosystem II stability/assembly factor-like uncharacterized protein